MALNITLAGTIYNSSNIAIDANLQIFVYNSNNTLTKWSDVFYTEDTDYNKNLGNPDISGQDNILGLSDTNGEYIIIAVWDTATRDDRYNMPNEFTFIITELQGDELYIQDIQLNKPDPILCNNWSTNSPIDFGDVLISTNNNTNEIIYNVFNIDHYLYRYYIQDTFKEEIFPYMGTCEVYYKSNDEDYSSSNIYEPLEAGDIESWILVKDCFGNESECNITSKVYYNIYPDFDITPSELYVNDIIYITDKSTGDRSQIIQVKYIIDGKEYLGYDVDTKLETLHDINITQIITFFNGYENVEVSISKVIGMNNRAPMLDLLVISEPINETDTQLYTFAHNGTDIDGYIEYVKWDIYRNNKNIEGEDNYSLYYSTGKITDLSDWTIDISDIIGELKIVATVYDNYGDSTSDEHLILNDCNALASYFNNIDWSKKIKSIDFSLTKKTMLFETKINKLSFSSNKISKTWDYKTNKINFEKKTKKYTFSYKICN